MVKRQLELGLTEVPGTGSASRDSSTRSFRHNSRRARTEWWFARMRQVVDEALEIEPLRHTRR
jgi:hypothetical protein